MTDSISRRALVRSAVWSVPVIAVAAATPHAAASQEAEPRGLVCTPKNVGEGDVEAVAFNGNVMSILFRPTARNWVDVTVRQPGFKTIHYNLGAPGQPTNNQPHMRNYTPGGAFTIALPRPFDRVCDWFQVQSLHIDDCVVTS